VKLIDDRHSNAIPCNPKSKADVQPQFDELLDVLSIPASLTAAEKLARLRTVPAESLLDAVKRMKMGTFRPVADGVFFPRDLMRRFADGDFARDFEKRGMSVLVGEVLNEVSRIRKWWTSLIA
jgi:carboxylesterase type B